MLQNNFFSHWDTNGYKPYMRYSLAGGKGAVAENIAVMYSHTPDLEATVAELERIMMYDDAEWDWGHRDNILKPFHNKVSIGIAYDNYNLYFVEDFEDDHIMWGTFKVNNYAVTMHGTFGESGYIIKDVAIVYGAGSVKDLVYKRELEEWSKRKDVKLVQTVDPGGQTPDWKGEVGYVAAIVEKVAPSSRDAFAVVCGPPIVIKLALPVLAKLGFADDRIYTTLENRMKCGLGKCGRCNIGPVYVCKDGPVFTAAQLKELPPEF